MARAPFNVGVIPFRPGPDVTFEFAVFRRADAGFWQCVNGGGEDAETPTDTARREMHEEARIPPFSPLIELQTVDYVSVTTFRGCDHWPEDLYVIPQHWFGVDATGLTITLSHEHTEFRWLSCDAARDQVRFDGNRTAIWELNQRLKGHGPRG